MFTLSVHVYMLKLIMRQEMGDDSIDDFTTSDDSLDYEKDLANGERASKNSQLHKRLDDLLEQKRLKALLDDTDDWDID